MASPHTLETQIRKLIEIEPDAVALTTRFQSEHVVVGRVKEICCELAVRVEALQIKVDKKRAIHSVVVEGEASIEHFAYMMHNNPKTIIEPHMWQSSLPSLESGLASILSHAEALWAAIHNGGVSLMEAIYDRGAMVSLTHHYCLCKTSNSGANRIV
jgi:hypothetical protein